MLPDTEHRALCADLATQIRRIQRKASFWVRIRVRRGFRCQPPAAGCRPGSPLPPLPPPAQQQNRNCCCPPPAGAARPLGWPVADTQALADTVALWDWLDCSTGRHKLIVKNKVVAVTIIETRFGSQREGRQCPRCTTCVSVEPERWVGDQAALRLASASAKAGSAASAAIRRAGRVGKRGAKKARGLSAKAHLLDERKDAALKRLGSLAHAGSPATKDAGSGRRPASTPGNGLVTAQSGCTTHPSSSPGSAPARASAEDAQLCTWVWYWSGARSKRLPHSTLHNHTLGGSSNAMRWVETSRAKSTGSAGEGRARTDTTRFTAAWLVQHIDELRGQNTSVFLRRNAMQACQRVLAGTSLTDDLERASRAHKNQCRGEKRKLPARITGGQGDRSHACTAGCEDQAYRSSTSP